MALSIVVGEYVLFDIDSLKFVEFFCDIMWSNITSVLNNNNK